MAGMRAMIIKIDDELRTKVKEAAKAEGLSAAAYIRKALREKTGGA